MATFRESVDALKEAGLADSEILEIMSESVDGENFIKKSGHELPTVPSLPFYLFYTLATFLNPLMHR